MKIVFKFIIFICFLVLSFQFLNKISFAQCGNVDECNKQIEEYQNQITKLQGQANTLKNQIAQFDAQIKLTTLKISQTEEKINQLSGRIDQLTGSLESLTKAYNTRVVETYKLIRLGDSATMVITSENLNDAFQRFSYLKKIQQADKGLLDRLQKAQDDYVLEKDDQEELQDELEKQKKNLDSQKKAKADLLTVTRNDEKRYQQLLASAKSQLDRFKRFTTSQGGCHARFRGIWANERGGYKGV